MGLLLDESGSMSWNDRATYARATAIILYDFCQALGIPITVMATPRPEASISIPTLSLTPLTGMTVIG